jgi:uncharacterized membrane protein YeaQ/YmgE (transglycosylase-associated protein family)
MDLIWTLLTGLAAGWLAGQIMKGSGYGLVGDLILGLIGSVLGRFLLGILGIWAGYGFISSLVVSTLGAVILIWIVRKLKKA